MDQGLKSLYLKDVQESLIKVLQFLQPYLALANAHATYFITDNYWDQFLPSDLQNELLNLSIDDLKQLPYLITSNTNRQERNFHQELESDVTNTNKENITSYRPLDAEKCVKNVSTEGELESEVKILHGQDMGRMRDGSIHYVSVKDFCRAAQECTLEWTNLIVSKEELLASLDVKREPHEFIGAFMNTKKCHEIGVMAEVCATLTESTKCNMVVDLGSGKGYLGSYLSLQYKLPVLGMDAMATYTQSAEERLKTLNKQWAGLSRNKVASKHKKKGKTAGPVRTTGASDNTNYVVKTNLKKVDTPEAKPCIDENSKENCVDDSREKNMDIKKAISEKNGDNPDILVPDVSNLDLKFKGKYEIKQKYVPVTLYIDKSTDFLELAEVHFPEIQNQVCENCMKLQASLKTDSQMFKKTEKLSRNICSATDTSVKVSICPNLNIKHEDIESSSNDLGITKSKGSCVASGEINETVSLMKDQITEGRGKNDNVRPIEKTLNTDIVIEDETNESVRTDTHQCSSCTNNKRFMLTGLHTCGNLASSTLDIFVNSPYLQTLCSVGCCYHLLNEEFEDDMENVPEGGFGFPKSQFLRQQKVTLGKVARNLASQSVHRMPEMKELQGERFYPRALLEVMLRDLVGDGPVSRGGLRKLEQRTASVQEYIKKAWQKLCVSHKITDEDIEKYVTRYAEERHKLAAFFQFKAVLAPCIETVIILDRVCFLLEQTQQPLKQVLVVQMFDPVISPRCYGVIARK